NFLEIRLVSPAASAPLALRVVEVLGALQGQRLPAHREVDSEDVFDGGVGVVFEKGLSPVEHLEEQAPGVVFDPEREAVMRVVPAVENQPGEAAASRQRAGEELVEDRSGEGAGAQEMNAETVTGERAGDVDDPPASQVQGPAVRPPRDGQASRTVVQLHPLQEV